MVYTVRHSTGEVEPATFATAAKAFEHIFKTPREDQTRSSIIDEYGREEGYVLHKWTKRGCYSTKNAWNPLPDVGERKAVLEDPRLRTPLARFEEDGRRVQDLKARRILAVEWVTRAKGTPDEDASCRELADVDVRLADSQSKLEKREKKLQEVLLLIRRQSTPFGGAGAERRTGSRQPRPRHVRAWPFAAIFWWLSGKGPRLEKEEEPIDEQ